jgi:hypothetical protein
MTVEEYVEMMYLRKRLSLLDYKFDHGFNHDEAPDVEVTLKEIEDINSLISSLRSVGRVYGQQ